MAKVVLPLLSKEARGRIGHDMVFDSTNRVRAYEAQADARTSAQLKVRKIVSETLARVKISSGLDRAWLRTALSLSWHLRVSGWLVKNQMANAKDLFDLWIGWSQNDRDLWESLA